MNDSYKKFKIAKFECNDSRKIKFLTDIEDAIELRFHYDYKKKIDVLCEKHLDKDYCEYCPLGLKLKTRYGFYILDLETNEIEIIISMVSDYSLLPHIVELAEKQGTLLSKDYVVDRSGVALATEWTVYPVNKFDVKVDTSDLTEENLVRSVNVYFNELTMAGKK